MENGEKVLEQIKGLEPRYPLADCHWMAAGMMAANPRFAFFWPLRADYAPAIFLTLWGSCVYHVVKPLYRDADGIDQIARVTGEAGLTRQRSRIKDGRWIEAASYHKTIVCVADQAVDSYKYTMREFAGLRESDCLIIAKSDILAEIRRLVREGYSRLVMTGKPDADHLVLGQHMKSVWTFSPSGMSDDAYQLWLDYAHILEMYKFEDFTSAFCAPMKKAIRDPERQREVVTAWRITKDGNHAFIDKTSGRIWYADCNQVRFPVKEIRRWSKYGMIENVTAIASEIGDDRMWVIVESDAQARAVQYALHSDSTYCDIYPKGRPREAVERSFNGSATRYLVSPASRVTTNPAPTYIPSYILFTSMGAREAFKPDIHEKQTIITILNS